MKVLFITDPGIIGGATRSLVDVVTGLSLRGVECVVCTSSITSLNNELDKLEINNFASFHRAVMDVPPKSRIKRFLKFILKKADYFFSLKKVVSRIANKVDLNTIDIIHTNSARNDIGCILSKKYKIKHIMHIREFGQEDFGCICYRNNYYKFINEYTDKFIAISEAVKNSWVSKGLNKDKVEVIYNGINNADILVTNQALMCSQTDLYGLMAGGICEAKGQIECVEAINRLPENIKGHIYIDFIGWEDSVYSKMLRQKINEYSLDKNIKFISPVKTIHPILKNYQFALMCSKSEGFGRVTAEYMFAGLGIIASDRGANTELITDRQTGLIYKYEDYDDLANKIKAFFCDRELLKRCSVNAIEKANSSYTMNLNTEKINNLYNTIINE